MPAERYFIGEQFKNGQVLWLEGQECHHLVNVMRTHEGDQIELVNGQGALAIALVEVIEKKKKVRLLVKNVFTQPPPSFEVILAQAIPRQNRLDFILEKGTELGMTQLWLFPTQHSDRKDFNENQMDRLRAITIAAMKQCGRLYLPKIFIKPAIEKWEKLNYPAMYGDVDPTAPWLKKIWEKSDSSKGVVFFIGPESGFTATEINILRNLEVKGVRLHPNILRTDTAALVALSLLT